MDEYLGIGRLPFKMSAEAMLDVAFWAQNQSSFQRAEDVIMRIRGLKVNDDTIRKVTDAVGRHIFLLDKERAADAMSRLDAGKLMFPESKKAGTLYLETDGAALNTRTKDNDGSTWKENKLGVAFSSDNIRYWTDAHGERQHQVLKREYTSFIGSSAEFGAHMFALAIRNGYGLYGNTVILSDGATWIRNMKNELFPDAQQILDYYHLCENVCTYAKHVFSMAEADYRPWTNRICAMLKKGRYKEVLNELAGKKMPRAENSPVNLAAYIENNRDNIDYPSYERKGFFIGSGAIESANKTVLQKRLKQAGMRWNTATAQPLLTLIAKKESGLWACDVEAPIRDLYSGK
ncbi:MAG: hypothetical protein LBG12_04175 [Synergistaceae bacterium]|jgi:hypothetical protein|nr:hypothetical protein [Synergistaceae bacterium]